VVAEKQGDAHQVRGQLDASPDLDPKGYRLGGPPSRIFDKLVEHASREM